MSHSQKFKILVTADTSNLPGTTIAPARTAPILVLSKRKDRKRKHSGFAASLPAAKVPNYAPLPLRAQLQQASHDPLLLHSSECALQDADQYQLLSRLNSLLHELEWPVIGYGLNALTGAVDGSMPILRCPKCKALADSVRSRLI